MAVCVTCSVSYDGRNPAEDTRHKTKGCITALSAQQSAILLAQGHQQTQPPVMPDSVRRRIGGNDSEALSNWDLLRKPSPELTLRTHPSCYWLDPEGGTIRDAVRLSPNGAKPGEGVEAKYCVSWQMFKEAGEAKGWTRLGHQLQKENVELIVETLEKNRPEELEVMNFFRSECEYTVLNGTSDEARKVAQRSIAKYSKLIEELEQPLNAEQFTKELDEIARAQRMSAMSPDQRAAIREMIDMSIGSSEKKVMEMATAMAGPAESTDSELTGPDFIDYGTP